MDFIAGPIANLLGIPLEEFRIVFCMLFSYPLAFLFRKLPDATSRHWFAALSGFWFVYYCYAWNCLHPFIEAIGAYLIVKAIPKEKAATLCFAWCMGYLSIVNVLAMTSDFDYKIDITGVQMVLTIKLISFGYDYTTPPLQDPTEKPKPPPAVPSLLEFFGYVYFFCTVLSAPAFDMQEYLACMDLSLFQDKYCKGSVPDEAYTVGIKRLLTGVLFVPLAILSKDFTWRLLLQEPYIHWNIIVRFWFMWFIIFLFRAKYYFAWNVAEGSATICGLAYNGVDDKGNSKWDRISNVDFFSLEFAQNITMINAAWNKGTTKWLKKYVYNGLAARPGKAPGLYNTMITYLTSSVWHGFYPGYYLFFVTFGGPVTELSKDARRYIRPYFLDHPIQKRVYDFVGMITTILVLHYGAIAFIILDFWSTIYVWNSFYWSGHIAIFAGLLYFRLLHRKFFPSASSVPKKARTQ